MLIKIPNLVLSYSFLSDTTLCSIVRDEKINPAGGIESFVNSHVPFVEQAVIADTGSIDGTREILESMKNIYPNLRVIDLPFEGYATTRNKALNYVQTKKVLILDADELLTHETPQNDWVQIKEFMNNKPSPSYRFLFDTIYPNETYSRDTGGNLVRLFDSSIKNPFVKELWEGVRGKEFTFPLTMPVTIKHFLPSDSAVKIKFDEWYMSKNKNEFCDIERLEAWKQPPSDFPDYCLWKEYNSQRDNYK